MRVFERRHLGRSKAANFEDHVVKCSIIQSCSVAAWNSYENVEAFGDYPVTPSRLINYPRECTCNSN